MTENKQYPIIDTISFVLSLSVITTGFTVLMGWLFDLHVLKSLLPGLVSMKANTAFAFLLAGLAMLLQHHKDAGYRLKRLAQVLVFIVTLIALFTLSQYLFDWNLGFDQVLFRDDTAAIGTSSPGRMAPLTATNFLFAGIALLLSKGESAWSRRVYTTCAILIGIISYITLTSYLYGAESMYGILDLTQMALHTAAAFVILSLNMLMVRRPHILTLMLEKTPAGIVLVRLLPAVLVILPLFGWLRWQGEVMGLYDTPTGLVLFTLFNTGVFVFLVWNSVYTIDRLHRLQVESESYLRHILDTVPVAISITRISDGTFLDTNERFATVLGITGGKPIGSSSMNFYDDPIHRDELLSILAGHDIIHDYELRIRKADGSPAWIMLSMQHMTFKGEKAILSSFQDITDHKYVQDQLQASEERFRSVVQNANDVITIIDGEGNVTFDSASVKDVLGYDPNERIGQPALNYVHPDALAEVSGILSEIMAEPGHAVSLELQTRHKDGTWRVLEARGTNLIHNPAIGGLVAISRDITERKQLQQQVAGYVEELKRSNEELQQFAYVASHDLQEPLRMVTSYLQLLVRRYGDRLDEDAYEFIDFAVDGANRMKALINDLLGYSRVGTRGKPFTATDSHAVIGYAIKNLREAIRESNAVISVDNDLPTVAADEGQLVQIFQNLINNAIKFQRADVAPHIHISTRKKDNHWVFSVADNGIGIEPQYAERIFVIFQRLHTREEYGGTGIGLAICQKIVERHGGCIWVDSQPGVGSTFYFTLPVSEEKI